MEMRHRLRTGAQTTIRSSVRTTTMVYASTLFVILACIAAYLVLLQDNSKFISLASTAGEASSIRMTTIGSSGLSYGIGVSAESAPSFTTSKSGLKVPVFYPKLLDSDHEYEELSSMIHKLQEDIHNSPVATEAIALDVDNPPTFVTSCGNSASTSTNVMERIEILRSSKQPHLALELIKYCALDYYKGGLYLDAQSPLTSTLDHILAKTITGGNDAVTSLAVLNDPKIAPKSIHSGIFYISKSNNGNSVVSGMVTLLMTTSLPVLESSPLLLPKSLYNFIANDAKTTPLLPGSNNQSWYLLQHTCHLVASLGQRQVTAPISNFALSSYRYA
jgi:hypothetical protein